MDPGFVSFEILEITFFLDYVTIILYRKIQPRAYTEICGQLLGHNMPWKPYISMTQVGGGGLSP